MRRFAAIFAALAVAVGVGALIRPAAPTAQGQDRMALLSQRLAHTEQRLARVEADVRRWCSDFQIGPSSLPQPGRADAFDYGLRSWLTDLRQCDGLG